MGEGGKFDWGGVEGWGEKAYNCNWITIKNKKKPFNYILWEYEQGLFFKIYSLKLLSAERLQEILYKITGFLFNT